VVFQSDASNLGGAGVKDENGQKDVFLRDTLNQVTILLSVDASGNAANGASFNPVISADGSTVAFESLATNLQGVPADAHRHIYVVTGWQ
jgi:Tol biopolymer transport system component